MISKLQYISQGKTEKEHLNHIQRLCDLGVDWIQLRLKNQPEEMVLETAKKAKEICRKANAKIIINDHVHIAKEIAADGVHLGKSDLKPEEARKILGSKIIIGATANSLEDCVNLNSKAINYIGLGPFRFTKTKAKLSPTLGINGYQDIINKLKNKSLNIPIIAIGGIEIPDIPALMKTKIFGIAVSGMLSNTNLGKEELLQIKALIND